MWTKKTGICLNTQNNTNTSVSTLKHKGNLFVGCENGLLKCYKNSDMLFQSQYFTLAFDYLESCDVLEKITGVDVYDTGGVTQMIIVCNERNLKLYDVRNNYSTKDNVCMQEGEQFEQDEDVTEQYTHTMKKEYTNVHSYVTNSVSLNNDSQYFITSDYLFVNLWKPEILEGGYTIVNIKPTNQGSLVYVINAAKFSQYMNTVFGYSTTNGEISLYDIRLSSEADCILKIQNKHLERSDAALKSISDFNFVSDNLVTSRSLNNVALCDIRNPMDTIYNITISEKIAQDSSSLDTDAIYEKFRISSNKQYVFTGSFSNEVYAINIETGAKEVIVIDDSIPDPELDKTKFVEATDDGVYIVYGDTIYQYNNIL